MSRKDQFVLLVQTWVLAKLVTVREDSPFADSLAATRFATACVVRAIGVDEDELPDDLERACEEFMCYIDPESMLWKKGFAQPERPAWLRPSNTGFPLRKGGT